MQLGSCITAAVALTSSCSSISTPSLVTSICCGSGPKKKKKKKKRKKKEKEKKENRNKPTDVEINLWLPKGGSGVEGG